MEKTAMTREELELIIAEHTRWLADHSEPLAQIIWQVGHQADCHKTETSTEQ